MLPSRNEQQYDTRADLVWHTLVHVGANVDQALRKSAAPKKLHSTLGPMARAAVLVPCQSDCAEVLPEDVSADEVLQVCMHNFARTSVLHLTSGLVTEVVRHFRDPC